MKYSLKFLFVIITCVAIFFGIVRAWTYNPNPNLVDQDKVVVVCGFYKGRTGTVVGVKNQILPCYFWSYDLSMDFNDYYNYQLKDLTPLELDEN